MEERIANLVARPRQGRDDEFILDLSERAFSTYSARPRSAMASMLARGAVAMVAESRAASPPDPRSREGAVKVGFFVVSVERLGRSFGPWPDPATAHLDAIGVVPDARGRGVGRFLLEHAEEAARALGAVCLSLMTAETNARARGLFGTRGFHGMLTVERAYARGQRGILMTKAL